MEVASYNVNLNSLEDPCWKTCESLAKHALKWKFMKESLNLTNLMVKENFIILMVRLTRDISKMIRKMVMVNF